MVIYCEMCKYCSQVSHNVSTVQCTVSFPIQFGRCLKQKDFVNPHITQVYQDPADKMVTAVMSVSFFWPIGDVNANFSICVDLINLTFFILFENNKMTENNEGEKQCLVSFNLSLLRLWRCFVYQILAEKSAEWEHGNDTFAKHMCTVNCKWTVCFAQEQLLHHKEK